MIKIYNKGLNWTFESGRDSNLNSSKRHYLWKGAEFGTTR
jgi:hypothetical protein